MAIEIVVTLGGSSRRFAKDVVKIGRLREADVCLEKWGNLLSRYHAAVFHEDGDLYVKDLGSRTGTFLNGERVTEPVSIEPTDVIQLGGKRGPALRFEAVSSDTAVHQALPPRPAPRASAPTEPPDRPPETAGRKRPLTNSTVSLALEEIVKKERARASKIVRATIASALAALVVVVVVLRSTQARSLAAAETAREEGVAAARSEMAALHAELSRRESELLDIKMGQTKDRDEKVTTLEKEVAALRTRLERQQSVLDANDGKAVALVDLAGTYDLSTTEGNKQGGLRLARNGDVVRWVEYPDGLFRTRWGKATLEHATLAVRFENPGDPRDLSGDWDVLLEQPRGRSVGTATFERLGDAWAATLSLHAASDAAQAQTIQLSGTLAGKTLEGVRADVEDGTSQNVSYTLSQYGLELTAKFGDATERLWRRRLPPGEGTTATYTVAGLRIAGALATGAQDSGRKREAPSAAAAAAPRPGVRADPAPDKLVVVKDTAAYAKPQADSRILEKLAAKRVLKIVGREDNFWSVPIEGSKSVAYVPMEDMTPVDRRYVPVRGPIFKGRPSATAAKQLDLGVCYLVAALMAIARTNPDAIVKAIHDEGDGTVTVNFFYNDGRGFEPRPIHINKTVVVDDAGEPHYATGDDGQMWPPLIVKAFASLRGGFYGKIVGGTQAEVFEALLGRAAVSLQVWNLLPAELNPALAAKLVGPADAKALAAWARSAEWKAEQKALLDHPGARASLAQIDRHLDRIVAVARLSRKGRDKLHDWYAGKCEGKLGTARYSERARSLYRIVKEALAARHPIGLGTQPWGHGGTGRSAGENVELVPGLASSHAYVVEDACEHDGLLWLRVANPWQYYSRVYARGANGWSVSATARDKTRKGDDSGVFEVELSDVMRYFGFLDTVR